MTEALSISARFSQDLLVPLLMQKHPDLVDRLAIGVHGTGSDVLGLDDSISRDHHWGPRAAVLLHDEDASLAEPVRQTLAEACPREFEGHPVRYDAASRTAVFVDTIGGYLGWFLGASAPPQREEDWFALCETDLLHLTAGPVFHDPSGRWSAIRAALAYYPERVWHKRIADWCMYVTGRDAPYNLYRVSRRGDELTSQIYFGQALRRSMELAFAIERHYAPYPKWQFRLLQTLGGCARQVTPILKSLVQPLGLSWRQRVDRLIEINWICARRLHELGLTSAPAIKPFDEALTDLTLYVSARELYQRLPASWHERSFNPIESWEKIARVVLFDTGDYFQRKYTAPDTSQYLR